MAYARLFSHKHANTQLPPPPKHTHNVSLLLKGINHFFFPLELKFELLSSSLVFTLIATTLPDRAMKFLSEQSAASCKKSAPFYFIGDLAREANPPAPT